MSRDDGVFQCSPNLGIHAIRGSMNKWPVLVMHEEMYSITVYDRDFTDLTFGTPVHNYLPPILFI